jgi:hypothetical protein
LRQCRFKEIEIPQADFLLLSQGVTRASLLSYPILDCLAPSSRLIVCTESLTIDETNDIPHLNLRDIPFSFAEWQRFISSIWEDILERITVFQRDFNPNHMQTYSIFSNLCWSVATVLKTEYLFEKSKSRLIFTEADRKYPDSIIIQVARKMGIPSVTLVHGVRGGNRFYSSLEVPLIADRLVVWGEWMQRDYIQLGVSEDQVLVGGYPRIHPITNTDRRIARELLDSQGVLRGKKIIVMLNNNLSKDKPAVELFVNAQHLAPDCYFMIRPHPQENLDWYRTHVPDGLQKVQDPHRWTLMQSLSVANVVVGAGSTACIDAILVGVPLILLQSSILDYGEIPILQEAVDRKAVAVAGNADDLARLLQQNPNNNNKIAQLFAQECAACLGTEAAHLTAEILRKLARHQE